MGNLHLKLIPAVIGMMMIAGLAALDDLNETDGATGLVVLPIGQTDCRDTDNNDIFATGVTISEIAELSESDTCVGDELLEYYCGPNGFDVRVVQCSNGCSAGACR